MRANQCQFKVVTFPMIYNVSREYQSAQTPMSAATNAGPNPGPSQRWQRGCPRDVTATSTTPTPPVPGDAQRWHGLYTGHVNKRTYTPARWPTGATLNPSSSQADFQYSPAQARQNSDSESPRHLRRTALGLRCAVLRASFPCASPAPASCWAGLNVPCRLFLNLSPARFG